MGENPSAPHVLHKRDLTQTLHDRVVVHQYHGLVWADLKQIFRTPSNNKNVRTSLSF
jgi:hypothetical protein